MLPVAVLVISLVVFLTDCYLNYRHKKLVTALNLALVETWRQMYEEQQEKTRTANTSALQQVHAEHARHRQWVTEQNEAHKSWVLDVLDFSQGKHQVN